MYLKFFGLFEKPFNMTPDPRFLPEPLSPNVDAVVVNTLSRSAASYRTESCRVLRHFVETAVSINLDVLRVMVIAALAWCPILAPRPPSVLAQAHPAPSRATQRSAASSRAARHLLRLRRSDHYTGRREDIGRERGL